MTREEWMTVFSPVVTGIVWIVASFVGLLVTGLLKRLQRYFDARGDAEASSIVADASTRVQAAMQNEAGNIALLIQSGKLDVGDLAGLRQAALEAAGRIKERVPDALKTLQPADGSVAAGVLGKVTTVLPMPTPAPAAIPAPVILQTSAVASAQTLSNNGTFQARAGIVVGRLMKDLGLARFQAAGIVGNLGQESGLEAVNEIRPVSGRGGFGWAQWTGVRRDNFEDWCKAQGLSMTDQEANYGFLVNELQTTESDALTALKATKTLEEATATFEARYERAGVVAMSRRQTLAQQALAA